MKTFTYLDQLIQRQHDEGWSDREMGRQLGIHYSGWCRIRNGQRHIGARVLRRMMNRFPEYNALALVFFFEDASERGISAPGEDRSDAA